MLTNFIFTIYAVIMVKSAVSEFKLLGSNPGFAPMAEEVS